MTKPIDNHQQICVLQVWVETISSLTINLSSKYQDLVIVLAGDLNKSMPLQNIWTFCSQFVS